MKKILIGINSISVVAIVFLTKFMFYFRMGWKNSIAYADAGLGDVENHIAWAKQNLKFALTNLFAILVLIAINIFLWFIYLKYTQDGKPIIDLEKIKKERQARKKARLQEKLDKMNEEDN